MCLDRTDGLVRMDDGARAWLGDMANQWVDPPKGTHPFMFSLIFSEMASFGVLLAGFVKGYLL